MIDTSRRGSRYGARARVVIAGALHCVSAAVTALLIGDLGFAQSDTAEATLDGAGRGLLLLFSVLALARLALAADRRMHLSRHRGHLLAAVVAIASEAAQAVLLAAAVAVPAVALAIRNGLLGSIAVLAIWRLLSRFIEGSNAAGERSSSGWPLKVMFVSFPAAAAVGALFLMLPQSRAAGAVPLGLLDAFFTATSAICVTGLTVVDTGTEFSVLGQSVIMLLIQFGGLGIMTFAAFFSVLLGRGTDLTERAAVSQLLDERKIGRVMSLLAFVVIVTLVTEVVGALVLLDSWPVTQGQPLFVRFRYSLFHAVSAFCNAGFALEPLSLERFVGDPLVLGVVAALITIGGLGFSVQFELLNAAHRRLVWLLRGRRRTGMQDLLELRPRIALSLHARLALGISAVLVVVGGLAIFAIGGSAAGSRPSLGEAMFLSVSSRTAGFTTRDLSGLPSASLLCIIGLMFIGASPGSTGGGIKTTTAGVLLAAIRSMWRHRVDVDLGNRTVPTSIVRSAFVILCVSLLVVFTLTLALAAANPTIPFEDILFEVVSAFATVGLSTGITPQLGPVSRVLLCVAMYLGRLGPLSLMVRMTGGRRALNYRYAEEGIVVG